VSGKIEISEILQSFFEVLFGLVAFCAQNIYM